MCENLFEKYSKLHNMASDALNQKWDTREELMSMAKPKGMARIKSLASSKKSFKRDRKVDTRILNDRSSELLSTISQAQIMSPQQLFEHFE